MKKQHLLPLLICALLLTIPTAEAQIFKKIKEKINTVTGSKEKEKDSIPDGNERPQRPEMTEEERQKQNEKMRNFFGGGLEEIRDTYSFSYSLVYELTTSKESMPLQYLLEPEADYFANKIVDKQTEQLMVYDFKKNAMVMFMENEGQKMAMKMKMPNAKKMQKKFGKKIIPDEKEEEVEIVPIEGRTILGYECNGFEVTSKDGVGKFWVTNDTPVSLNGVYANFSSLPKSTKDEALPLNEKSLVMEMVYTAHKKKKENMHMICKELKEQPTVLHKKEYKSGM